MPKLPPSLQMLCETLVCMYVHYVYEHYVEFHFEICTCVYVYVRMCLLMYVRMYAFFQILPSLQNEDPLVRDSALNALALMCILDRDLALKHFYLLLQVRTYVRMYAVYAVYPYVCTYVCTVCMYRCCNTTNEFMLCF